jgi:hypothetical protein
MDSQTLILAIGENRIDKVEFLLKSGTKLDKYEYLAAVLTAIANNNLRITTILFESAFYVESPQPLCLAARKDYHLIVSYILTKSKCGIQDAFNDACKKGRYNCVSILIKFLSINEMRSGLDLAIIKKRTHIIELLRKHGMCLTTECLKDIIISNNVEIFEMAREWKISTIYKKFNVKNCFSLDKEMTYLDIAIHCNLIHS